MLRNYDCIRSDEFITNTDKFDTTLFAYKIAVILNVHLMRIISSSPIYINIALMINNDL